MALIETFQNQSTFTNNLTANKLFVTSQLLSANVDVLNIISSSINNSSVYTTTNTNSANWNSAYTTLNSNSGTWVRTTNPTASGTLTLTNTFVSVSGQLAGTVYSGISAYGSTDRSVVLAAKGTGATVAQLPDGTSAGGDNRGTYATDWQKNRVLASQVASGNYSTIGGGHSNTASGCYSTIGGGRLNTVSGVYSTVGGGRCNTASGCFSNILGGCNNNTNNNSNTFIIGSGITAVSANTTFVNNLSSNGLIYYNNKNSNDWNNTNTTVSTNSANWNSAYTTLTANSGTWVRTTNPTASGTLTLTNTFVSVSGQLAGTQYSGISAYGSTNRSALLIASGTGATVAQLPSGNCVGGNNRGTYATDWQKNRCLASQVASGNYSTIGGGCANTASGCYSTVGGGRTNLASGYNSTVGGGGFNTASGYNSTVGGGYYNCACGNFLTIGGGYINSASGTYSTVGGGCGNCACGAGSTIGGGCSNCASGHTSTVGGGCSNCACGTGSTIGGGQNNTASGCYSSILGGCGNNTNNNNTFIIGSGITASQDNTTFVNNLSSQNLIYAGVGNSDDWNSTYTTVSSNSANWSPLWLVAQKNATQTLNNGANDVATPFETILGGTMQDAWNTTTGEFTAPKDGLLKISGVMQGLTTNQGSYQEAYYELKIKRSGIVIAFLVACVPSFDSSSFYYTLNENPNSCIAVSANDVLSVVSSWFENYNISLDLVSACQIQFEYL